MRVPINDKQNISTNFEALTKSYLKNKFEIQIKCCHPNKPKF